MDRLRPLVGLLSIVSLTVSGCTELELPPETDASTDAAVPITCSEPAAPASAGVTFGEIDATAIEGGDAVTYTIVLDSEPCTYVSISPNPDGQTVVAPAELTFTPENWDTPQTFTVTIVHDFEIEGAHASTIAHGIESGDDTYAALSLADVTVNILDRAHVTRISRAATGGDAAGDSLRPVVSNDGRWVAFVSSAGDLVSGDDNGTEDVFLRDVVMASTERISVPASGDSDGASDYLDMSDDGSVIAFNSRATNLTPDAVSDEYEVFLWMRGRALTQITQVCEGCDHRTDERVSVSGDGAFVAFSSRRRATPNDEEGEFDVFTYSVAGGALSLDSLNSADENGTWTPFGFNAFWPRLSTTGAFVSFYSAGHNLATPEITVENFHAYVKDRTGRELVRVSRHDGGERNCDGEPRVDYNFPPFVTDDGNVALFHSGCAYELGADEPPDTNGVADAFVRDIAAQTTTRISLAFDGTEANGSTRLASASADGRFALFWSEASNLVLGDTNGVADLFVHDRMNGTTVRVSVDEHYEQLSEAAAFDASISNGGEFVVFSTVSPASSDDGNGAADVYRIQLRAVE